MVIWSPRSEEEIQQAADNGLLVESHYLDLKREVTATDSGTKGIRRTSQHSQLTAEQSSSA